MNKITKECIEVEYEGYSFRNSCKADLIALLILSEEEELYFGPDCAEDVEILSDRLRSDVRRIKEQYKDLIAPIVGVTIVFKTVQEAYDVLGSTQRMYDAIAPHQEEELDRVILLDRIQTTKQHNSDFGGLELAFPEAIEKMELEEMTLEQLQAVEELNEIMSVGEACEYNQN